jgi:hypothetical protein
MISNVPASADSYSRFAQLGAREDFARDPVVMRAELGRLLADHSTQLDPRSGRPNSLCLHLSAPLPESGYTAYGDYGTRSSSLIFIGRDGGRVEHFFAAGPPCTSSYEAAITPRSNAAPAA